MTPLSLDEVLADIRQLPSLPAAVNELIRALDNESTGIDQLADGISKDQSLAARALRVANSPFYGVQHKVASIHEAIVVLGFRAVGSLVTAASITGFFSPPREVPFDLTRFWRHSIGTALCARALARKVGLDPEVGFTAGLLHDIGVLMLLTTRPTHYAAVLAYQDAHDGHLREAEHEVLGFDHGAAGEALALRWRFPTEIVRAVALHHTPSAGGSEANAILSPDCPSPALPATAGGRAHALQDKATLIDVVHFANILAHALDLATAPQALVPPVDPGAWRRLGLTGVTLKSLLAGIEQEHESYCALLAA